jgi:Secretion system C-terminal sorting domain
MKKALILLAFVCLLITAKATIYYSDGNSSPNTTSNWHVNRDGTGASPNNFNGGHTFVIQNGHSLITTNNWNVGGSTGKIIIENGGSLTAEDKNISAAYFEIESGGTYIHNKNSTTLPGDDGRTFASGSTVIIKNWGSGNTALPSPTIWGNLTIDLPAAYNNDWNQAGNLTTINGSLKIISTGTKEFRLSLGQAYTLTIGVDLILQGGQLETGESNTTNDQTIIVNGSYNQSGGTFSRTNSSKALSFQFNGSNSGFTHSAGTLSNAYINWKLNAGKKLTLNNDLPVASSSSITVDGTIDCSNKQINGAGSFTLNGSGKLITSHASGVNGSVNISGAETMTPGASYEFNSATSIPFPTLLATVDASNVTINANVTLNKDVTISGTLTLTTGKLIIPAGNSINITSGNPVSGSGFSNTKHIVTEVNTSTGAMGFLRIGNFSGTASFPVGNGSYYMPVTLTTTGLNDFSVCVFQGATTNGQPNGTAFSASVKQKIVDAIWMVNRNSGSGGASLQVSWPAALEGTTFSSFTDAQIGLSHYGGAWDEAFGSGSQSANTATRPGIYSFSPFAVGKTGLPLPLKFGEIKLTQRNGGINIDWISLTEINVDHYEIERSTDGSRFGIVKQVRATGNNSDKANYNWLDLSANSGTFFYRIKAVDFDGKLTYSTVARISIGQTNTGLILYPNPAPNKRISFQLNNLEKGQYQLSVYDMNGKFVYQQLLEHSGGAISQSIEINASAAKGIYNFRIKGGSTDIVKMFISH